MNRNQHLYEKFTDYGLSKFEDVEVLELYLGLKLDNINHRARAEKLLENYSTLNEIIDASIEDFENNPDIEKQHLFGLRMPYEAANRYLFEKAKEKPVLNFTEEMVDYLKHSMQGLKVEHFKVLFLDGRNGLIAEEDLSKGTINRAAVYPREVIKTALKYNAVFLILAHNHVSGNQHPSYEDLHDTEKLFQVANLLDMHVLDHIIISGDSYYSFSEGGYMDEIREKYGLEDD